MMNIKWNKKKCIKSMMKVDPLLVTYNGEFKMYVYSDNDFVSNYIKNTGIWKECESLFKIWQQYDLYNANGYFVDVGANIGTCSLKMLNFGIKTISFEPVKDNLYLFTKSLLYNKNMLEKAELYTVGLSNSKQKLPMYINKDMGGSSFNGNWSKNIQRIEYLKLFTLDDIYNYKRNISLLKIDVEGYEYNVLKGATNLLKSHRIKVIYIEINCIGLHKSRLSEAFIYSMLSKYKYNIVSTIKCKGSGIFDIYGIADDYNYAMKK